MSKHTKDNPGEADARVTAPALHAEDMDIELSVRPTTFDDFVGQEKLKDNLRVFIEAARGRGEALDHVLSDGGKVDVKSWILPVDSQGISISETGFLLAADYEPPIPASDKRVQWPYTKPDPQKNSVSDSVDATVISNE